MKRAGALTVAVIAITSIGCAKPSPAPPPRVVAVEVPREKPRAKPGHLLVYDWRAGLVSCAAAPGATGPSSVVCRPNAMQSVAAPLLHGGLAHPHQNGGDRYLLALTAGKSPRVVTWDATRDSIDDVPDLGAGVVDPLSVGDLLAYRLDDGGLVRFQHFSQFSRMLIRGPSAKSFTPMLAYENGLHAYDFRFLPDGRHLFRHTAGMGKAESPYFVDVVLGDVTSLYFVDHVGGTKSELAKGDQLMRADFVDDGRRVAWFRPGKVDEAANTRDFVFESIEIATRAVQTLATVTLPYQVTSAFYGKGYRRDAPSSTFYPASRWVLHAAAQDESGRDTMLRLEDVVTGEHFDHALGPGEHVLPPFPYGDAVGFGGGDLRRWSDVVIVCTDAGYADEACTVRSLPTFEPMMTLTLPRTTAGAEWLVDD